MPHLEKTHKKGSKKLLIALMVLIQCSFMLFQAMAQKPKLGLVLSGGGAKGMAHIGVLKAMEEAGLRPDYIAGTSMGSIIGGLYAIGYSADQIEGIIREIHWDEILSNNIPMNYISYEEKEYYNRFLIELPLVDGKLSLPSGLIEGQMLSEALNHYTWPAMKYGHFDELPIPFRCVATDVSTGKPIVFDRGSLAEAMRASMAIPTAFSAADLDSTLAVDGGVVNNFPADVLKDMGADIVIGVNVARGFVAAKEVNSMTGILMQMSMLSSNQRLPQNIALCDVYIQPNLDDYNTASFSKYDDIITIGDVIGQDNRMKFDSISAIVGKQDKPRGIENDHLPLVISSIELSGNQLFNKDVIYGKLGIEEGDTVSPVDVEEGVRTVFGINGFNKVEYRLNQIEANNMSLKIKMKEKPPIAARASFHYDNIFSAGIVVNLQFRDLLLNSSRTILAGDASVNPRFRFDYYKYIGYRKKTAMNVRYDYYNEQIPTYEKGRKDDLQASFENAIKVNFLTTQSLKNSYLIGIDYENHRFRSVFNDVFASGLEYGQFIYTRLNFAFNRNTLNNQNFPTNGAERLIVGSVNVDSDFGLVFADGLDSISYGTDQFSQEITTPDLANQKVKELEPDYFGSFYLRSIDYVHINDYFQLIPNFTLGLTLADDTANKLYNPFIVGGHQQVKHTDTKVLGLNYSEFNVDNFAVAGLMIQNVYKNFYLQYGANVMLYNEHVPISKPNEIDFNNIINNQTLIGYGGELIYKSFIGPITLGISSNSLDGYVRYYFALGYSFNYSD